VRGGGHYNKPKDYQKKNASRCMVKFLHFNCMATSYN
jgi:hypothetical protein